MKNTARYAAKKQPHIQQDPFQLTCNALEPVPSPYPHDMPIFPLKTAVYARFSHLSVYGRR